MTMNSNDFDGVYIFSPSGCVFNEAQYARGVSWLNERFGSVQQSPNVLAQYERFAGDNDSRLQTIHAIKQLQGKQLIIASRGGYGLSRLLPHLDLKGVAEQLNQTESVLCGHSDVTSLQLALMSQGCEAGRLLHGPMVSFDFGAETLNPFMLSWFEQALSKTAWSVTWDDPVPLNQTINTNGVLWGGNLAMVCSLIGTPFMPAVANSGGVLFLEDVNEHPYRVERLLLQLLQCGILGKQQAVLLGQFNDWQASPIDNGYNLASAVKYIRSQTSVPILSGLPFGHVHEKLSLPMGAHVSLTAQFSDQQSQVTLGFSA